MTSHVERDTKILALYREKAPQREIAARCGTTLDVVETVIKIARKLERIGTAVQEIPIVLCRESPTARPVLPVKVEALARSIADVGLRQPINVRPLGEAFEVRGGGHRLAAFRKLGRETIPAFVRGDDDLHAELAEIDENLIRNDLSPIERSAAQARRKAIYQELHPETKAGGDRRSNAQLEHLKDGEDDPTPRYDEAASEDIGQSPQTIRREVHRGEVLGDRKADISGTSLDKGDELDALAKLPEEKRDSLIDRAKAGEKVSAKTEIKKDLRDKRERDTAGEIPAGKFGVIVCDDEWDHVVWSRNTGMDRHASNHYETADDAHTAAELHERTKARFECAADDCFLGMWATVQHLAIAVDLLRLRGFRYVSHYVWGKDKIGLGYWNRNKHEILLIGIKGDIPCPAPGTQWESLIMAPRGDHSAKPEIFLELIEAYFPTLPKIELNRRGPARPGWDAWGLEVEESQRDQAA